MCLGRYVGTGQLCHGRLPGCSDRGEGVRQPPGGHPAPGAGASNRARWPPTGPMLERACPKCRKHWTHPTGTGLERYDGGPAADGDLGAE